MVWKLKNSEEEWAGGTHELAGSTFTGVTRTPMSKPLIWVEPKKPKSPSKQKSPRKKQEPKPKGATAWD